ncbi:hypothetical protein Mx9_p08 [Myxococcus phage Mx9]|nr:hypothetical protein Mx9_p08 [Myxococcus phage Mx9]
MWGEGRGPRACSHHTVTRRRARGGGVGVLVT